MTHNIPYTDHLVQTRYEANGADLVDCGTLNVLLAALEDNATVLLMPFARSFPNETEFLTKQFALHLIAHTCERAERSPIPPLIACTFLVAEPSSVGWRGQGSVPRKKAVNTVDMQPWARQLQEENLQRCLVELLFPQSRLSTRRMPARYRLPDTGIWCDRNNLTESGITFTQRHWRSQGEGQERCIGLAHDVINSVMHSYNEKTGSPVERRP